MPIPELSASDECKRRARGALVCVHAPSCLLAPRQQHWSESFLLCLCSAAGTVKAKAGAVTVPGDAKLVAVEAQSKSKAAVVAAQGKTQTKTEP